MQIDLALGHDHLLVEVPEDRLVGVRRRPPVPPLADPAAAVRAALESPFDFPALWRALTPNDHVAVIVDEQLPRLVELVTPVLEHVVDKGHVAPEAITLLCPPSSSRQEWLDGLPDAFQEARLEIHDPRDRRQLSYLATTRRGRRLYLNRTAIDADQLIILAGRGYDPVLGWSGAAGALYPAFSDEATREEVSARVSLAIPGEVLWPARQEADEAAWLLGAPFQVQVIEGAGDEIAHVLAGLIDTSAEGQRLLNDRWRVTVDCPTDTVVASLSGDPARHDFAALARAATCAARVVRPNGRIVLLTRSTPELGAGADLLRQAQDPDQALLLLRRQKPRDLAAVFSWASAAQHARIFLLSGLPEETAEQLFAIPLEDARQVQNLLREAGSCLFLNDAHKTLAVVDEGGHA